MKQRGFNHALILAFLLSLLACAILALAVGCNVSARTSKDTPDASSSQQLPFTEDKALTVPANTVIYVRLQQNISSATARPGQDFAAVLDEPLMVDGQTVAPQGAAVTGKIAAASQSSTAHGSSYLRITLSSLIMGGKMASVHTNSAFVSGGGFRKRNLVFTGGGENAPFGAVGKSTAAYATEKKEVGFAADRRLGFRLTQPILTQPINVP